MKKSIILLVAIVLIAGLTNKISAQTSETKSNEARAQVLTSIGLSAINPLEFGGFMSAAIGTVVLTPLSVRTATGGVTLYATSITPTAASYNINGAPNASYTIVVPTTDQALTRVGNAETMIANLFTCSYPSLASTLDGSGIGSFSVGATLEVGAAQAPGVYVGNFDVTIAY
ncbi:MAG: DUF4402 domain-containing protein [Bacteroidales bacterium]|nr:DUF4402 domain-containing protein [Bacteroidales bacterium]